MAPQLSLGYSSQAPIYGTLAAGWSLSLPEIREDTSQGRLQTHSSYYEAYESDPKADDRFTSSLAGGRPLVKVTEPFGAGVYGAYRARNDSSFARYERMLPGQPYKWRVWAVDGSVLYFGEPAHTSSCTKVSEGYAPLTSVVDAFGNSVFYDWESTIADECRIKQITWGQNATASLNQPFAKVEFNWQVGARCDDVGYIGAQIDYRTGTRILTGASKLDSIRVTAFPFGGEASPTHTRLITLGYAAASEGCANTYAPMRQLASIQESAWGTNLPQVNLPAVRFEYGSPAINLATTTAAGASPPWSDAGAPTAKRANLGWGSRPPPSAADKWPTVEAMMVDLNGDGLLDRLFTSGMSGGDCVAGWQRNLGPTPGSSSTRPNFGGTQTISLPRLRWRGGVTPIPFGGGSVPATGTPYFEACALNGQVTAFRNVPANASVPCHDGSQCQFSTTPGLTTEKFCYSTGEFGLQCPSSGSSPGGDYRTYLAYRWFDADGDGLTDLVTAVHGNIKAYDIVQGIPSAGQPRDSEPFGPWPACPNDMDRCKQISRSCLDAATTPSAINKCIVAAPSKACGALATSVYSIPGQPPQSPLLREPYERCEGLYPWMIYKNTGNGVLASTATIKYSPVPLESETADSNLTGMTVSSAGHGIFDFDGDGRADAVKLDEQGINWQVWLGDGTGGFSPRINVVYQLPTDNKISSIGFGSSWGAMCQSATGTFDLNGDGLLEHWRLLTGNASVAWNNGTGFITEPIPGANPPAWTGTATTPIAAGVPIKPGNDVQFTVTEPVPVFPTADPGR